MKFTNKTKVTQSISMKYLMIHATQMDLFAGISFYYVSESHQYFLELLYTFHRMVTNIIRTVSISNERELYKLNIFHSS